MRFTCKEWGQTYPTLTYFSLYGRCNLTEKDHILPRVQAGTQIRLWYDHKITHYYPGKSSCLCYYVITHRDMVIAIVLSLLRNMILVQQATKHGNTVHAFLSYHKILSLLIAGIATESLLLILVGIMEESQKHGMTRTTITCILIPFIEKTDFQFPTLFILLIIICSNQWPSPKKDNDTCNFPHVSPVTLETDRFMCTVLIHNLPLTCPCQVTDHPTDLASDSISHYRWLQHFTMP